MTLGYQLGTDNDVNESVIDLVNGLLEFGLGRQDVSVKTQQPGVGKGFFQRLLLRAAFPGR